MSRRRRLVVSTAAAFLLALPAGAAVPAGFVDEAVAGVSAPTAIAFTPDGRMLVTTQPGQLQVRPAPYASAVTALDLSALPGVGSVVCTNGERGLLGVAVDPEFAANRFVYLYYTFNGPAGCKNRVARFVLPDSNTVDPASQVVLVDNIHSTAGNHNGGDVQFGRDGLLYVTVGDGGCDYANDSGCGGANDASRDRNVLIGKVLRVTRDGDIPAGNPFQGPGTARCNVTGSTTPGTVCQETFAWGLRNPFRFAFDPGSVATRFFLNDVGQNAWEEIDVGEAGVDYGWNCREGDNANPNAGASCAGFPPASPPASPYRPPVYEYGRSTGCGSITGGAFVPRGAFSTDYDGHYLFADYNCGKILRLASVPAADNTAVELAYGLGPVVHLRFGPAAGGQALYYTTYNYPGQGSQIRRVRYTGSASRAPVAALTAQPSSGTPPLLVTLTGTRQQRPRRQPASSLPVELRRRLARHRDDLHLHCAHLRRTGDVRRGSPRAGHDRARVRPGDRARQRRQHRPARRDQRAPPDRAVPGRAERDRHRLGHRPRRRPAPCGRAVLHGPASPRAAHAPVPRPDHGGERELHLPRPRGPRRPPGRATWRFASPRPTASGLRRRPRRTCCPTSWTSRSPRAPAAFASPFSRPASPHRPPSPRGKATRWPSTPRTRWTAPVAVASSPPGPTGAHRPTSSRPAGHAHDLHRDLHRGSRARRGRHGRLRRRRLDA